MKFIVPRETLLKPLQLVAGAVERRQTLPILGNILLEMSEENKLKMIGTDLEVELHGNIELQNSGVMGATTVPARKFLDICKTLPEGAMIEVTLDAAKLLLRSGKSRFSLATLPAAEFPHTEEPQDQLSFKISQSHFRQLIEKTQFAMAQQDVRYFLNGLLLEIADNHITAVATDGHRMAFSRVNVTTPGVAQVIIPRKGVMELSRLLADTSDDITVILGSNQLRVTTPDYVFSCKLIDGKFPDYNRVIPHNGDKILVVDKDVLKQALNRMAVLVNEKHRGVRFEIDKGALKISTHNPDLEAAEEELSVNYQDGLLDIGFNIDYLSDAISALPDGEVKLILSGPDTGVRIESLNPGQHTFIYVVMPMRL